MDMDGTAPFNAPVNPVVLGVTVSMNLQSCIYLSDQFEFGLGFSLLRTKNTIMRKKQHI